MPEELRKHVVVVSPADTPKKEKAEMAVVYGHPDLDHVSREGNLPVIPISVLREYAKGRGLEAIPEKAVQPARHPTGLMRLHQVTHGVNLAQFASAVDGAVQARLLQQKQGAAKKKPLDGKLTAW